jgi:two-component system CheB/CheR fusion protein
VQKKTRAPEAPPTKRVRKGRSPGGVARPSKPATRVAPSPSAEDLSEFPIVGIGASAGGLEAMTQLLNHLPSGSGMALVLVQHLDPTHESALTSILARSTVMPVVEARNNMRLAPDHVYVIPPNKLMRISSRRLRLAPRGSADTMLAIDHFLRALAEEEGSRAIGLILSGSGSDGTQGLLAIKAAGGITFAQDEKTAKYPAMPASAITAGCVDFVLPPERIARELTQLAGHPYIFPGTQEKDREPRPADDRALEDILLTLRQRTGVDFLNYKHATLRRRIQRRMALQRIDGLRDYAEFLRHHATEVRGLYNDILIHVTGFFRDPATFGVLKKKIFPRLLRSKGPDEPLRIWVPGCSTGEEVYSIAIAVIESQANRRPRGPVQIFGTDINDAALEKARAGVYPEQVRSDVSAERLERFFTKVDAGYRVNKNVREVCIFARQNLVVDPPFSNIDLISCRNVLIYLGPTLQRKVLPLFHYALRPAGFLMLGASETIGGYAELFSVLDRRSKVYSKKSTRLRPAVSFGPVALEVLRPAEVATAPAPGAPSLSEVQKHADRILLSAFSPAGVIINRHMEVLQFRGRTGPFLEHAHGEASLNLLKMAREGLALDLRTLVTRAIKQSAHLRKERVRVKQDGHFVETDLEVIPFTVPPAVEKFFMVLFGAGGGARTAAPLKPRVARRSETKAGEENETGRLRAELAATRESLQEIIEEQEATNEELRSASEETMSSNEELQSTNEELETAKEELQSTNEELTTLNDELESRNTELQQVNNDLHNLLASVNIPIMIVDSELRIQRFTAVAEQLFNLIPGDIGRPMTDINLPLNTPELSRHVLDVLENLSTKDLEVKCARGRWWSMRIRPYRTTDNKIDGAVIAMVDIETLKAHSQHDAPSWTLAGSVIDAMRQPVIALDKDAVVRLANHAFCQMFSLRRDQLLGRRIYDLGDGRWDDPMFHTLLEEKPPAGTVAAEFVLEHEIPGLGRRTLSVTGVRVAHDGEQEHLFLLSLEDVSGRKKSRARPR